MTLVTFRAFGLEDRLWTSSSQHQWSESLAWIIQNITCGPWCQGWVPPELWVATVLLKFAHRMFCWALSCSAFCRSLRFAWALSSLAWRLLLVLCRAHQTVLRLCPLGYWRKKQCFISCPPINIAEAGYLHLAVKPYRHIEGWNYLKGGYCSWGHIWVWGCFETMMLRCRLAWLNLLKASQDVVMVGECLLLSWTAYLFLEAICRYVCAGLSQNVLKRLPQQTVQQAIWCCILRFQSRFYNVVMGTNGDL